MKETRDYEIWMSILDTLYISNKITYEDMFYIKGYFSACMKPNTYGVTPMEMLYEKMKGKEKNDKQN